MAITTSYYAFSKPTATGKKTLVVTSLTPQEESDLDKGYPIDVVRSEHKFRINPRNIIVYGEIDFADDSEDLDTLEELNLFEYWTEVGFTIPAHFSYKYSCFYLGKRENYYDTIRTDRILQYIHAKIGKPNITVVFEP